MSWYASQVGWQFRFETPADEPEPVPVNLPQVILRSQRSHAPIDLPSERERRRGRVSTAVCRKGRVCSGAFACPCKTEDHRLRVDFFDAVERINNNR